MRADMRYLISIKSPPPNNQNSFGETIKSTEWVDVVSDVWASKEPILGREFFAAESVQSKVEVKWRTYFIPGIENNMRIYHENEAYEILSVIDPKGLNRELLFYCSRVPKR